MGLRFEGWAIFIFFLSSNAVRVACSSLHFWGGERAQGTAVQFTFTNAGVAQTQNRGRPNTAANYLPCLRVLLCKAMRAIWVQLGGHF